MKRLLISNCDIPTQKNSFLIKTKLRVFDLISITRNFGYRQVRPGIMADPNQRRNSDIIAAPQIEKYNGPLCGAH
jgi:hypothetical protein